jgi:sporulation protein YlmC with PRC-barrel domain
VTRLSDLRDKKVKTLDGQTVGRIHDVHCDQGRIVALMCGAPSFIERLTARTHGRRIPWEEVLRIDKDAVVIASSASRSPPGTRRASAPRSKR